MYKDIQRHYVDQEEYFEMDGISNSDVSLFYRSPSLFRAKLEGFSPVKETKPMQIGSAFDTYLLEQEFFDGRFVVAPSGIETPTTGLQERLAQGIALGYEMHEAFAYAGYKRPDPKAFNRLRDYADFLSSVKGRTVLSFDEMNNIRRMADSVERNGAAWGALKVSESQVVFTATHEETGLKVKGMLDLLGPDFVADLKTTGEEVHKFPAKIYRYDYDRQIAHYCALAGLENARFIAVERDHLSECDCFELSPERLDAGMRKMDRALKDIKLSSADNYTQRPHFYTNNGWMII